ncbi:MAG TPA: helix-turn-helix domain-containing protein [Thermoanaerobaculia bacterium]|jgi:DNA-binding HxlR family transcriptional regulator
MPSNASSSCSPARSVCPIANALDLLGDKWTLLVVRDLLLFDKRRFGEFLSSQEGIPTNILTDRLRRLEECGIVTKVAYQSRPPRHEYHLTAKGADLLPVLRTLVDWANRHIPGAAKPPPGFLEKAEEAVRSIRDTATPDGRHGSGRE